MIQDERGRSYSDFSLRDLLDAFAATAPVPAGGSAAALTGAIGVSLLVMAAAIRTSRSSAAGEPVELAHAADRLRSLRPTMALLVDRDAEAYSSVIAAGRLPADDEESASRRQSASASAMRLATDVPLDTMRQCRRALREAPVVAAHAIRTTHADVGVAIELLHAAVRAAGITLDANLASLAHADDVEAITAERRRLDSESAADAEDARSQLQRQAG